MYRTNTSTTLLSHLLRTSSGVQPSLPTTRRPSMICPHRGLNHEPIPLWTDYILINSILLYRGETPYSGMLRLNQKKTPIKNTPVHIFLHVAVNNINSNCCFALFLNPIVPVCQSARLHFTAHLNTKHICTSLHQMHERFRMHFWLFFLSSLV